ncbi:MAG: RHS domain-containing protein [Thiogranum sp.]
MTRLEQRTFVYYDENRLYQVYENGVWLSSYEYNAQGQRVKKTTANGSVILYQYDLAGHLISELHYDGTRVRDYVWLDDTLVAQIEADGSVHYLHGDHLDTPRAATDADGTVVWRWESEAFGGTPAQFVEGLINTIGGLFILNTALKYDVDTIPAPPSSEAAGR